MDDKIKNSEAFLNSVAKKQSGFSVPENYFKESENYLANFLTEEQIPKKNSFSTPDNYFDTLEDSILAKATKKPTKVISLKKNLLKIMSIGVAASILLLLGINFYNTTNDSKVSFDDLAKNDIENWFIDDSYEITTEDITAFINLEEVNTIDLAFTTIKNNDIEEYIINNNDEILLDNDLY